MLSGIGEAIGKTSNSKDEENALNLLHSRLDISNPRTNTNTI